MEINKHFEYSYSTLVLKILIVLWTWV